MHVKVAGVRGGHKLFFVFILGRGGGSNKIFRANGAVVKILVTPREIYPTPPPPPHPKLIIMTRP